LTDEQQRGQRVADNERRIREFNERLEAATATFIEEGFASSRRVAEFLCACGRPECSETITLPVEEYRAVHEHPYRFIVVPGHEDTTVERVVERHDGYDVVEKRPQYRADGPR
jgi:hypothetical protein